MSKELVINSDGQNTRIAIVEKGDLAELFIETEENERTIGNLFLGRIRRVMPSIQAAFVDIGQKQDAFLHFSDLTESIVDWLEYAKLEKPEIAKFAPGHVQKHKGGKRRRPVSARRRKRLEDGAEDPEAELALEQAEDDSVREEASHNRVVGKRGRGRRKAGQRPSQGSRGSGRRGFDNQGDEEGLAPETFLKRDQPILVKISKEPIAQKGSRVTTDISLAGRFLVLVPMANYVAVSKKISSFKERRRLRALAKMLLPDGFGVIVRTVAEGQNAKALDTDLRLLKEKWQEIESRLCERPKPPAPIYEDVNMVSSIMRDLFSEDFDRILIDEQRMYRNIKGYVQAIAPEMGDKVVMHDKKTPVFRSVGIERSVSEAFESRVNLPSGGYLFIEQTEAMHVVDVNSGRAGRGLSQEENSLKVNLEAAKVIARQIRLRDLGGILVIDFIDMRSERSRRKVYEQMRREFRKDRAVTKVLPMSDFGLMQITRQRLRPSITHTYKDMHDDDAFDTGAPEQGSDRPTAAVERLRERPRDVDPDAVVKRITDWLEAFGTARWKGAVKLKVHPFTAAYLSKGWFSYATRCFFKYRIRLVLDESAGMDPARFRFFDETNGKEIRRPPRRGRKKSRKADDRKAGKKAQPSRRSEVSETKSERGGSRRGSDASGDTGRSKGEERGGRSRRSSEEGDARRGDSRRGSRANSRGEARNDSEARRDGRRGDSRRDARREERNESSGDARSRNSRTDRKDSAADAAKPDPRSRDRGRGRGRKPEGEASETKAPRDTRSSRRGRPAKSESDSAPESAVEATPESQAAPKPERSEKPSVADVTAAATPVASKPRKPRPTPSEGTDEKAAAPAESKSAAADSAVKDSAPAPERKSEEAPQSKTETVRPKTSTPQPFKLRYSSSHTSESAPAENT